MAFIAGSVLIGGGISALGGIAGAAMSSHAAGDAADKQAAAEKSATDLQHQMFEEQRNDQQPWRQAGIGALSQMADPSFQHDFGAADFQQDPGYQFRMQQGLDAIQRSAAARGGLQTGGTLKSLNDYAQGSASQEYQNAYDRFTNNQTNRFNRLASLAGIGQTANGQMGQASQNYANNTGNIAMSGANAQGAAGIAQGNTWGSALSSLGSGIGNTWMNATMMNKMFPSGGGGGGYSPMASGTPMAGESYGSLANLA